jgi:3-deoxy-D-manno-octulosonate 8-phosphate phosphatase (KDO 8-P phosphatase)
MQKKIDIDLNQITTIFFDVDGVFTDGSLYFSDNGVNTTKFNVHDGMGCILLKETGIELLILTARHSDAVIQRFKGLGINKIFTKVLNKQNFIRKYTRDNNLTKNEIAMMGDDLQDLLAIDEVGLFFTTPNAVNDVKNSADYITKRFGGDGAVREICDLIISSKGSTPSLQFQNLIKQR